MEPLSQHTITPTGDLCRDRISTLWFLNSFLSSIPQCLGPLPSAKAFLFFKMLFLWYIPYSSPSSSPSFPNQFPISVCIRGYWANFGEIRVFRCHIISIFWPQMLFNKPEEDCLLENNPAGADRVAVFMTPCREKQQNEPIEELAQKLIPRIFIFWTLQSIWLYSLISTCLLTSLAQIFGSFW